MKKIIRVSAIPASLRYLLKGQLKFLSQYYEVTAISSPGDDLLLLKEEEGIKKTIPINIERKISLFKDCISLLQLIRTFRREKPDIVHSITPKAGLLSMLAAKVSGVPVRIHTFTGLIFPTSVGLKRKLLIFTDKITCWAATTVYPEGKGVMNDLLKNKITNKPLKILANGNVNGIDVSYFDVIDHSIQANIKFTFCFVGRIVQDKGINELIHAFICLYEQNPNVELIIVGTFERNVNSVLPEVRDLILNHPAIFFKGWQTDIRPFLSNANAFVFPSYREGFPNVVMQAGAMGLPSIVTDINGCNEIIIDGVNGMIIPPKDEKALFQAMSFFISNPCEVEKMANCSRVMITSRYERKLVWNALLAEYRFLLKE